MLKQIYVAECDYCGRTEKANFKKGRYNEMDPALPDGWGYGNYKNFHLCPECLKYMKGDENNNNGGTE